MWSRVAHFTLSQKKELDNEINKIGLSALQLERVVCVWDPGFPAVLVCVIKTEANYSDRITQFCFFPPFISDYTLRYKRMFNSCSDL